MSSLITTLWGRQTNEFDVIPVNLNRIKKFLTTYRVTFKKKIKYNLRSIVVRDQRKLLYSPELTKTRTSMAERI